MKITLLALLAGAVAGASASLLTQALVEPAAPAAPERAAVTRAGGDVEALRTELDELAATARALDSRLASLELAPRSSTRAPASSGEAGELAELRGEVEDLLAALQTPGVAPPPSFQDAVRRTLEDVRAEEQRQRDLEREQERVERLEQRVDRMVEELALAPYQVEGFRKVVADSEARRDAAFALAREGGDWQVAREAMRDLRDQTQRELSGLLTPEQMEQYEQLANPRFGRGGARGRGGDGAGQ